MLSRTKEHTFIMNDLDQKKERGWKIVFTVHLNISWIYKFQQVIICIGSHEINYLNFKLEIYIYLMVISYCKLRFKRLDPIENLFMNNHYHLITVFLHFVVRYLLISGVESTNTKYYTTYQNKWPHSWFAHKISF